MTVATYAQLRPSYTHLWSVLEPLPEHMPTLQKICHGLIVHKADYQAVAQTVWGRADYWWVVALIDQMEGGGGANTFLGNGQSLHRMTTEEPLGEGPFASFHEGAVRALHIDGLDKVTAWPASAVGYWFERYNGTGYMSKPIVDPYLASWSNMYTKGKYIADHVYDASAVSEQPGALTILKVLITIDPTINVDEAVTPQPKEPTVAAQIDINAILAALQPQLQALIQDAIQRALAVPAPPVSVVVPAVVAPVPLVTVSSTLQHIVPVLDMLNPVLARLIPPPYNMIPTALGAAVHLVSGVSGGSTATPASIGQALEGGLQGIGTMLQGNAKLPPWLQAIAAALQPPVPTPPVPATPKGQAP